MEIWWCIGEVGVVMSHENLTKNRIATFNWSNAIKWCGQHWWDTFGKEDRPGHKLLTRFGYMLAKLRLI